MHKSLIVILGFVSLSAQILKAEIVFYRKDTQVAAIDCKKKQVTIKNTFLTKMKIRANDSKDANGNVCESIAGLVDKKENMTLLTVATATVGDSIYEESIIGVLVEGKVITTLLVQNHDPVKTQYCGLIESSSRSTSHMCLMESDKGHLFVEINSVQQHRLDKMSVTSVKTAENKMVLEAFDSGTRIDLRLRTIKIDDTTYRGAISFGTGTPLVGPESLVTLNKQ